MYLNHHLDSVTHEQRDNKEVYDYRLYVAFRLYLCLQKHQSMKNSYQVPKYKLKQSNIDKSYFVMPLRELLYFQII